MNSVSSGAVEFGVEMAESKLSLRGFLHRPDRPNGDGIVLTHGAGANCDSALLRLVASTLTDAGYTVLRVNLPFRQARPFGPPMRGSAERDQQGLSCAAQTMRKEVTGRVYLGGHSYGGRQATLLAATDPNVADGLLLLSYPLHPPNKPEQMRTSHFPNLRTPALFAHGSRDGFGSVEEMESALRMIPARTRLITVEAGHELLSKRTEEGLRQLLLHDFAKFFAG